MERLLGRIARADLLVFGTPLYHFSMTGLMKTCIDRTLPLAEPWLTQRDDGLTTHPRRHPRAQAATALLVSPCGFPELGHFAALVATFRLLADRCGWDWAGEILRPAAGPLAAPAARAQLQPYLDRLAEAGQALVATRRIAAPLAAALAEDLLPGGAGAARAAGNRHWARLLGEGATVPAGLAA
jgi:hypothetical protein